MADASIHTHGTVSEVRSATLYRVGLANGKTILAHLSKRLAESGATFSPGQLLLLELTPYDFDQARILEPVDPTCESTPGGAEVTRAG